MSSARIHLVYSDLLYNCLTLAEGDARALAQLYTDKPFQYPDPYKPEPKLSGYKAETIMLTNEVDGQRFMSSTYSDFYFQGVRSIPSHIQKLFACEHLSKRYDLEGVPGFYFNQTWRLNIYGQGIIKPYRNEAGRIIGLFLYESPGDPTPRLLSSKGLYKGTEAIQPSFSEAREAVA